MATPDPPEPASARSICSQGAPKPVGPYSQAVAWGELLFLSGQIPLDPVVQRAVEGPIERQTEQVLDNLRAVLEAAGSSLSQVLRTTIYLTDLELFPRVNAVYARYFDREPKPARSTVEVARLPLDVAIEIDAIACCPAAPPGG